MLATDMDRKLGLMAVAAAGVTVPVVTVPLFRSSDTMLEGTIASPLSPSSSMVSLVPSELLGEVPRLREGAEWRSNRSLLLLLLKLLVLLSVPALLELSCIVLACCWCCCCWLRPRFRDVGAAICC